VETPSPDGSPLRQSSTVENYLKALYVLEENPSELTPVGLVAEALDITPGTATTMVKRLAEAGHVHYEPRSGVALEKSGRAIALQVIRRHRLVELFLVEVLGLDWDEVHAEAEVLEHHISERVLEAIDAHLGSPKVDPHGDPIPDRKGRLPKIEVRRLSECPRGGVRVQRVEDQDPEFLRFVDECGLVPGSKLSVDEAAGPAGVVTLRVGGRTIAIGTAAAEKVWVTRG